MYGVSFDLAQPLQLSRGSLLDLPKLILRTAEAHLTCRSQFVCRSLRCNSGCQNIGALDLGSLGFRTRGRLSVESLPDPRREVWEQASSEFLTGHAAKPWCLASAPTSVTNSPAAHPSMIS